MAIMKIKIVPAGPGFPSMSARLAPVVARLDAGTDQRQTREGKVASFKKKLAGMG